MSSTVTGAFAAIAEVAGPLRDFCNRRFPSTDADDLAQEVLLRALRVAHRGCGPRGDQTADWRRYLFKSASNRSIDHGRARRRTGRHFDHCPDALAGTPAPGSIRELAWSPMERADLAATLTESLNELHPAQRAICRLHFEDGFGKRAIGRMLGWPESTVRAALARGTARWRAALQRRGLSPQ